MSIKQIIHDTVQSAIGLALGEAYANVDPLIKVSGKPEFGDYQANFAMALAKQQQQNPRELATKVVQNLNSSIFEKVEVAGPGFINLYLKNAFIAEQLQQLNQDPRCGVGVIEPQRIVVDYGGPNVAKEMHVGHLRSTVIGDAIARVLAFLGHDVIRQNHLGDWGTQFGMLIQNMLEQGWQADQQHTVADLNTLYQAAKQRYDADADFAKRARDRVVLLQAGDAETVKVWRELVQESERHFNQVYQRLRVLLSPADVKSESSYNADLANVVNELTQQGLAETSEGAKVVFLEGFSDQNDKPLPFIIQKSDGGYLYATTDLAAIKYRLQTLHAQRLIYVIDARQNQHLAMLFATTRKANWADERVVIEHAAFGAVLGDDRRPFKTRSGETVKLNDLLDEAKQRATAILAEKKSDLSEEQKEYIADIISIAAIKYADLSSDRVKDYVFDWNRMLSFDGNSAPYLLNAYVRIQAIFRKGNIDTAVLSFLPIVIQESSEHTLALKLLAFPDIVMFVAQDLAPHYLCHYLCDLAANFHYFYENCQVLTAGNQELKLSRLALLAVTAKVLQQGLALLGIKIIDQM